MFQTFRLFHIFCKNLKSYYHLQFFETLHIHRTYSQICKLRVYIIVIKNTGAIHILRCRNIDYLQQFPNVDLYPISELALAVHDYSRIHTPDHQRSTDHTSGMPLDHFPGLTLRMDTTLMGF